MILTDREIMIRLETQQIIIDPKPDLQSLSSTSVDLTLAPEAVTWIASDGMPIRPSAKGYSYANTKNHQQDVTLNGYSFEPHSFLLAWTKEYVALPARSCLAARVEGKSSLARLGIGVHVNAPTIHAGFSGRIQLEMFNFGPHQIILDHGLKICQLIFEQTMGTPDKGYSGGFSGQGPNRQS